MSLKSICPCDISGICPYGAESYGNCEWWCGAESDSYPENEEEEE